MARTPAHILVIDDDPDVLHTARFVLKPFFTHITVESNPQQINYLLTQQQYNVVLLDMNYTAGAISGKEGLFWLKSIKKNAPATQVVMMTAYGEMKLAVDAMKLGAMDFVIKPWENEKLIATVHAAVTLSEFESEVQELRQYQQELSKAYNENQITLIGKSAAMKKVIAQVRKVARTDANVLVLGENGTGKELVAQLIHQHSLRVQAPFIKVDLGSLTESLFESELFGHKKGAFTDAKSDRTGRFKLANKGSIFLDEIGNLNSAMQVKLLSVLQNKRVTPVGGDGEEEIDIRVISATNQLLEEMIKKNQFREDLLYRINTIEITIPPLRDRMEDIPDLLDHFIAIYSKKYRRESCTYDKNVIPFLQKYSWPGNVRELQHAIERAMIMSQGSVLTPDDFHLKNNLPGTKEEVFDLDTIERNTIERVLALQEGNMTKSAKVLGIGRATLYRKLEKYGIVP